ncbi:MAG: LptE family protein [Candidatus Hydrogenedentes bacterium]|nr:LptE family protein [Candidatus Hydrogenedentota bacterium]
MKSNAYWPGMAALAALLLASGCAYRLGSTLPPGIETVHVPTIINQTDEPSLESEVTRALVREFQRDGTLKIAEASAADARLEVTAVGFKLEPLRYERDSTKSTREYRMLIDADLVMFKSKTDTPMLTRHVQGEATFDFIGDMATSKAQALPEAARDLSHDIVEAVVEYW